MSMKGKSENSRPLVDAWQSRLAHPLLKLASGIGSAALLQYCMLMLTFVTAYTAIQPYTPYIIAVFHP